MRFYTLAFSIAVHAIAAAAFVVTPLFATIELPIPRTAVDYIEVIPPRLPPSPPAPRGGAPARAAVNPHAAPVEPPDGIRPETGIDTYSEPIGHADGIAEGVPFGDPHGLGLSDAPLPPPVPAPVAPVRVGGSIRPPQKIRDAAPVYPAIAQAARVEGIVILEAIVGEDGRVRDVRVLRSVPLLDEPALEAVRQWRYSPTLLNGQPVPVVMTVTVAFQLQR